MMHGKGMGILFIGIAEAYKMHHLAVQSAEVNSQ